MVNQAPITPLITSTLPKALKNKVTEYENFHSSFGGKAEDRRRGYADMVNHYYDLATSFYEYGWGTSFHFAHRRRGETHSESIKRHEHFLALRLGLGPGRTVLDVGCGVGGPMREIALFSGASVVGVNNNEYQIKRANELTAKASASADATIFGKPTTAAAATRAAAKRKQEQALSPAPLVERCACVKADFMSNGLPDASFDAAYAIEATCHAPDAVACYGEILRTLKPGGLFAAYEWCTTDTYDASDPAQKAIVSEIELGNGLPDVRSTADVVAALRKAGFEVLEATDLAPLAEVAWWEPLAPRWLSLSGFRTTLLGRLCTRMLVTSLETLGIAPSGTGRVASFLERAGDSLVAGGKTGIFTPMFFFLARKPVEATPLRAAAAKAAGATATITTSSATKSR